MNGTDFRLFYEKYAIYKLAEYLKIYPSQIHHLSEDNPTSLFDLKYNNIRYDVKYSHSSNIKNKGKTYYWDFSLRKVLNGKRAGHNGKYCDYFILVGMKNGIPKKVFLVPIEEAPTNHIRITINGVSRYNKYEI